MNQAYAHAFHPAAVIDPPEKPLTQNAGLFGREHIAASGKVFSELNSLMSKILDHQMQSVTVNFGLTDFVIPGCLYQVSTATHMYQFWMGVNGPKLSFVGNICGSVAKLEDMFQRTFIEPQKVGWTFAFSQMRASTQSNVTTLWGSCISTESLVQPVQNSPVVRGEPLQRITASGYFHVHELAQVAQLFVRSMELNHLKSSELIPGPF